MYTYKIRWRGSGKEKIFNILIMKEIMKFTDQIHSITGFSIQHCTSVILR